MDEGCLRKIRGVVAQRAILGQSCVVRVTRWALVTIRARRAGQGNEGGGAMTTGAGCFGGMRTRKREACGTVVEFAVGP